MLLGDSSRKIIISSFLDFDFRPLGGHFVTDQIFDIFSRFFGARARVRRFTRCVDALPSVWMFYQVCGCLTRSHLGVLDPARSSPAARPRHGAPEKLSLTNVAAARPRHDARKNCCSPSRFGGCTGDGDGCQVPDPNPALRAGITPQRSRKPGSCAKPRIWI